MLKNTVRARIGARPYLFMTDAAATGLGLQRIGLAHGEEYPGAGQIKGRIVEARRLDTRAWVRGQAA